MLRCPSCQGERVVKNGSTWNGKQNHKCRASGRQFVERPAKGPIPDETKALVRRLLAERLSLAAAARVAGVSEAWLQQFVNRLYEDETPWEAGGLKKKRPAG
jgi:insertion element IS1 protein InsB